MATIQTPLELHHPIGRPKLEVRRHHVDVVDGQTSSRFDDRHRHRRRPSKHLERLAVAADPRRDDQSHPGARTEMPEQLRGRVRTAGAAAQHCRQEPVNRLRIGR